MLWDELKIVQKNGHHASFINPIRTTMATTAANNTAAAADNTPDLLVNGEILPTRMTIALVADTADGAVDATPIVIAEAPAPADVRVRAPNNGDFLTIDDVGYPEYDEDNNLLVAIEAPVAEVALVHDEREFMERVGAVTPTAVPVLASPEVVTVKLAGATQNYLQTLTKPYSEAIAVANTKDALLQWIPLVFQGNELAALTKAIEATKTLDDAKAAVTDFMGMQLLTAAAKKPRAVVTPWDVAIARDDMLTKWFGPASTTVPVQITVGPNVFKHDLTEEFAFGLLSVLNDKYTFAINGVKLTLDDLKANYDPRDVQTEPYRAILPSGAAVFNSPDVIQGVMTAAQWLAVKPNTLVNDFTGVVNGQTTALTF